MFMTVKKGQYLNGSTFIQITLHRVSKNSVKLLTDITKEEFVLITINRKLLSIKFIKRH
jgi:hypothetical protein